MNKIKAIIFDMDGVIIDSEMLHVMAENFVLNKYGVFPTEEEWRSFKGKTAPGIFSQVILYHNLKDVSVDELVEEKIDKFIEMIMVVQIELFEGFSDLIKYLSDKYNLSLVTSSHSRIQSAIFDRFHLHKFFPVVVTGDMVKIGKPDPEPYNLAITKLNIPADSCVVIEDSINGVLSAKKAGANVIAVTHTFPKNSLILADHVVESLSQIRDIL